jgi:hypothetical protein
MTQMPDFRRLAAECRIYAARCSIPAHAAALIDAAEIYERRADEAEAIGAGVAATPIRFVARGERETREHV